MEKDINLKETTVYDFYGKLIHKKLPKPSSIRRARRKCQEHYPETRGESYAKKQRHQTVIKKDVKREADKAINGNSKRPASNSR